MQIQIYASSCESNMMFVKQIYNLVTGAEILSPPLPDELKDGQWLGVNVRSQGEGGKVVVSLQNCFEMIPKVRNGKYKVGYSRR